MNAIAIAIGKAIDEVHELLAGDDLRFEFLSEQSDTSSVRVRLDLSAVECADCVLPPDVLAEILTETMRRQLDDPSVLVEVDDPRCVPDPH